MQNDDNFDAIIDNQRPQNEENAVNLPPHHGIFIFFLNEV